MDINNPLHNETPAVYPTTAEVKPFDCPVGVVTERAKAFLAPTKLPSTLGSLLLFKDTASESMVKIVADEIRAGTWGSAWCAVLEAVLVYVLHGQPRTKGTIDDFADELGKDHKLVLFSTFCELYEDFTSRMLPPLMVVEVKAPDDGKLAQFQDLYTNHNGFQPDKGDEANELMNTPTSGGQENLVTESFLSYLFGCLRNPVLSPNLNQLGSIRSEAIFKKPIGEFYQDLNELLIEIGFGSQSNKENLAHCWLNNQRPTDLYFAHNPNSSSVQITHSGFGGDCVNRFFKKYRQQPSNSSVTGEYVLPVQLAFRSLLKGAL